MGKRRVLLLGDMSSKWTFRYLKKVYSKNLEITVLDYAPSRLSLGDAYYDFCEKKGIRVIAIYNDGGYSRCLKYASIINQMETFDICHVMFVRSEASLLVKMCEHKFHQIIANFWGSDFFRTTSKMELEQKYLLDIADTVIVPVESMEENIIHKYPNLQDKIHTVYFESPILEKLQDDNYAEEDDNTMLPLPKDKVVIAVGYNGSSQQQHELFIQALNKCDETIIDRVFVIFSMTYGLSAEYEEKICKILEKVKFEYVLIKEYMTDEQIVSMRKRIDIFVNTITTDAFNAAIQESMLCQSVILVGDWLLYQDLEDEKAYVCKFSNALDLSEKLSDVMENLGSYREKSKGNKEIIKRIRKRRRHVEDWIDLYDNNIPVHIPDGGFNVWEYVLKQEKKQSERKQLYNEITQRWLVKRLNNIEPVRQYVKERNYKDIVIYGAGTLGKMVYDELRDFDVEIKFCDQSVTETDWLDKGIMKLSDLKNSDCDCVIITPVHVYNGIKKNLIGIGVKQMVSLAEILN